METNASFTNTTDAALDELKSTTMDGLETNVTKNNGWVVFQFAFYVLVIILGVLGNSLIIRVYSIRSQRASTKTTTAILVMALALSDLTVCVFRFRNLAILYAHLTREPVSPVILYLEIPDKFVIANTVSLTALIAFDRYDCVCRPHTRLLTYRKAIVAAVGCILFGAVANLPLVLNILNPFFYPLLVDLVKAVFQVLAFSIAFVMIVVCYFKVYYRVRQHVKIGIGRVEVRPRELVNTNTGTLPNIELHLASALTSTCPTGGTLLTGLGSSAAPRTGTSDTDPLRPYDSNSLTVPGVSGGPPSADAPDKGPAIIVNTAWASTGNGKREQASSHQHTTSRPAGGQRSRCSLQRKTTRMLFITSVVFILTWLPQGVYVGTRLSGDNNGETPVSSDAVFNLKPVLFFNNVVNPLIYGLANRRFRQDCIDVLKKLKHC